MLLVTGITGRVGGSVAEHLLAQGRPVRALVRDRAKAAEWGLRGVELVQGDLCDPDAITRALTGVEAAYLMIPPFFTPSRDFGEAKVLIEACGRALRATEPAGLVVLSSIGAEKTSGLGAITPLSLLERELQTLSCPYVAVRAGAFFENLLYGLHAGRSGSVPMFFSDLDAKHPMIAIEDVGSEVAKLLTGGAWQGRRVIELGSSVSARDVVAQLGLVLDRPVGAQIVPRDKWPSALQAAGFPEGQTWAFEEIYDGVNSGWIDFGADGAERVEGRLTARDVFAAAAN